MNQDDKIKEKAVLFNCPLPMKREALIAPKNHHLNIMPLPRIHYKYAFHTHYLFRFSRLLMSSSVTLLPASPPAFVTAIAIKFSFAFHPNLANHKLLLPS